MENVFINCPFDGEYQRLFRALVFTALDCGFVPRCALERDDGSETRMEKLRRIIDESEFGAHDISRTEIDAATGLPRFNVPLELGIFLGAKFYGQAHARKACVIFDRQPHRYQVFCSDIAGHDIRSHGGEEREVIRGMEGRGKELDPSRTLPGAAAIHARYELFVAALPEVAAQMHLQPDTLTFSDLVTVASEWLRLNRPALARSEAAAG